MGAALGSGGGPIGMAIGAGVGALIGWLSSGAQESERANQNAIAAAERNYERQNLELAKIEAGKAAEVAAQQVNVAVESLVVKALDRASALMRHEFAVQTLTYLLTTPLVYQTGPKTSAKSGCSCSIREKRCISGRSRLSGIMGIRS